MNMNFGVIFATDQEGGFSKRGSGMPWSCPEDLLLFKTTTVGHPVIMGRRTLESLPGMRPLPRRINIVLTRNPARLPQSLVGFEVAKNLDDSLRIAGDLIGTMPYIIGGRDLIVRSIADRRCIRIRRSIIRGTHGCDAHLPETSEMMTNDIVGYRMETTLGQRCILHVENWDIERGQHSERN
ncbi:MAG: dihydrofolate reductase [Gammaproteobacteria bacterium]|nr:dihydrofolate reductase [Gammaproteobacteria bacterium]